MDSETTLMALVGFGLGLGVGSFMVIGVMHLVNQLNQAQERKELLERMKGVT